MKKVIGILGVAVIATTMFFSASNLTGSSSDASLAEIIAVSTANAEGGSGGGCKCTNISSDLCYYGFTRVAYCTPSVEYNNCN